MVDQKYNLFLASLALITGTAMAHEGSGGGVGGFCQTGSFCHGFVDAFGHGLLGSGWIGFILVFGIWLFGSYQLIQYSLHRWAERNNSN